MLRRLYQRLFLALSILICAQSAPAASAQSAKFADWHWPLPAGEWAISRGPCGGETPYDHPCGYYEDDCAFDFVPVNGGDITRTPVLAPQDGVVVFLGRRVDAGIGVMLEHDDGRVSVLFHLSRAVVELGQVVEQGDVVGYAGSTGTTKAHLHFHVQKNIVERACVWLEGLDTLDYRESKAISFNLSRAEVDRVDAVQQQLDRLPILTVSEPSASVRLPIVLPPERIIRVVVRLTDTLSQTMALRSAAVFGINNLSITSTPISQTVAGPVFRIPIRTTSRLGEQTWQLMRDPVLAYEVFHITFTVGWPELAIQNGIALINPEFVSPASFSTWNKSPQLCWRISSAVKKPVQFRVRVVGPQSADSDWITATCWQPPSLSKGTYFWKVFVRDGDGLMNRTNQRPQAFVAR